MGRRPKKTFLQRQSHQEHEKMPNVAKHKANTNQDENEVSSHTGQNHHHQKVYMEKREPFYTVGGNVN